MALKDIFNMAKANRYTQDGRDQIAEALENETEDVRYKPGDISQKTGLQKQPDGSWAEPKQRGKITPKGKALMERAAKNPRLTTHGREAAAKLAKQYGEELSSSAPAQKPTFNPNGVIAQQKQNLENERYEAARRDAEMRSKFMGKNSESGSAPKFETEQENAQYARGKEGWDKVDASRLPDIKKKVEQKINYYKNYDPYTMVGKKTGLTAAQKASVQQNIAQAKENLAFYTGQLEGINERMNSGSAQAESKPAESKPKPPKPTAEEYFKAKDRVENYEKQFKKEMDDYEYMERIKANGVDTSIFNPMYGGKPKPLTENKSYMEALEKVKAYEAEDSAPRQLTGDCKIRIKKS